MNLIVTGNSGFVGQSLSNCFTKEHKVKSIKVRSGLKIDLTNTDEVIIHLAGKIPRKIESDFKDYYKANYELTAELFDLFLLSSSSVFLYMSTVKSIADQLDIELTEEHEPNPITHYGKSKLLAEQYILSKEIPVGKRVYILRPCMIHGPGNKGNLKLLHSMVSKRIPWPLGAFENKRSFCSIDNLLFIIKELIEREDIPSGVYNVADDEPLSTSDLIGILAETQHRKPLIWNIPKPIVQFVAKLGNTLKLPLNEERLQKLTGSYVVSNKKLMTAIGKPLPVSSKEGLIKTFQSFQ
jgi:nucleoside-diphosphate-sugar epimerase